MARFSTKNLTPAELKTHKKDLAASLKALAGSVKLNGANVKAAEKAHAAAVADAGKVLGAAQKAHAAAVTSADKTRAAALKAAGREAETLTKQVEAQNAKLVQVNAALVPEAVEA